MFFLQYLRHFEGDISRSYYLENSFGFDVNGSCNIKISPIQSELSYIGLLDQIETAKFKFKKKSEIQSHYCSPQESLVNSSKPMDITFHVSKKHRFSVLFFSCSENSIGFFNYTARFQNPTTKLDIDEKPCVNIDIIFSILSFIILFIWLCFYFFNYINRISIHVFFTVTIIFTFLSSLFSAMTYLHFDLSDSPTFFSKIELMFSFFLFSSFYCLVLLVAYGWCFVRDTIPTNSILVSIFLPLFFTIPKYIINISSEFSGITSILNLIFYLIFFMVYSNAIRHTRYEIIAHLVVISEADIDPKTTPIFKKLKLYYMINIVVIIYTFIIFLMSGITEIMGFPYWISHLCKNILHTFLMSALTFLLKPRKEYSKGYIQFEERPFAEFSIDDIAELYEEPSNFDGSIKWEEGMELPPLPSIDGKHNNNSHVEPELEPL